MRIFALLPAAGKSARMGRPKLALPLGDRTVLQRVLETLRAAKIFDVLVVLGPQGADLRGLAEKASAQVLVLHEETPDMRATVVHGLDWLERHHHPTPEDAFLLLPADHPTLDAAVIQSLLDEAQSTARSAGVSEPSIWVPTYEGCRGHPALISWRHVVAIGALPPGQGLNVYLRAQAAATALVPCSCAEILCDLDTPADYERLLARYAR